MSQKKSKTLLASAVGLALSSMMLSAGLNAGIINNSNPTPSGFLGACGDPNSAPIACVGAWDMGNVTVKLFKADGTEFGTFLELTDGVSPAGTYSAMAKDDSFSSLVYDWDNPTVLMAKIGGKVWPVGEPTGIKAVYNDPDVKHGKPKNCLINTAYLDAVDDHNPSTTETSYLDTSHPEPVICSSAFQTHKRFKIAMQPATVEGADTVGAEGKPIDLVFDVTDGDGPQRYQVFSKINNYTGKRLSGYKIQVGTGVGADYDAVTNPGGFRTAAEMGIEQKLFISLGIGEGMDALDPDGLYDDPNGENIFDDEEGLATFSRGLFGPMDTKFTPPRFPTDGFFDKEYAGFNVVQTCSVGPCNLDRVVFNNGVDPVIAVPYSDTIQSNGALAPSNYTTFFGDWLHSGLAPMGIFFDPDSDPSTDNDLMAYWNGTQWIQRYPTFTPVTEAELNAWAADPRYTIGVIEDTLNLGINYIVNVGDDLDGDTILNETSKITIRIIPVVGDQSLPAPWMTAIPAEGDLLPVSDTTTTTTSSGGGGCAVGGNGRFDPTLPALLAAGLGFFGWRRFKAGK